ncbi:MAG: CPBP family intramembrane metalloprotease [Trueperaceae bacterium]|nr:CPBP family intramembrane metalloprotease [Trueperaceae bacterium]
MHARTRLAWVAALTLVASLVPDVVLREAIGPLPVWWLFAKATLVGVASAFAGDRVVDGYGRVLAVVVLMQGLMLEIAGSATWRAWFPPGTFAADFGGAIALKLLTAVPIVGILLFVTRSPRAAFLAPGDLRAKASRIGWLGIPGDTIAWGRLALISGFLIAFGTLLLTLLTATGFALPPNLDRLWPLLPLIVVLALANSFAEGVAYRNAVLGPLAGELPKGAVVLASAAFFGAAHYYGVPSGVIGVVMSGALGWFLARAMCETRGFLAPWIIHFLQDVVIFSTIVLLGGY